MRRDTFQRALFAALVFACLSGLPSWAENASKSNGPELLELAESLFQKGDFLQAEKQLTAALESPELTARQIWNARFAIARTRMARKDYAAAREAFEKLAQTADTPGIGSRRGPFECRAHVLA